MASKERGTLLKEKHVRYIESLDKKQDTLEFWLTEHLRINGVYWGLNALCMLRSKDVFNREDLIKFVLGCYVESTGGFAAFPRHDAHLASTLSGIQLLKMYDAIDSLSKSQIDKCVNFIKSNQMKDDSFQGDRFGEVDTRFVYTAISSLSILERLTPEVVDPAVDFILRCYNFDGGFGLCPGAESHAAQVFTCLGTLAVVNRLQDLTKAQVDEIGWWLCERQVPEGGLNGRPSKLPDVCYSWWVLSSLSLIDRLEWIDFEKLRGFILDCQDEKRGGISDRPDNEVDVFHTVFGIAGLSLMGFEDLVPIDPTYCMTYDITNTIKKYPYN